MVNFSGSNYTGVGISSGWEFSTVIAVAKGRVLLRYKREFVDRDPNLPR
jgi:hypothetical protein